LGNQVKGTVECYAGSTNPEKPRRLTWQGQPYQVVEILHQWREPTELGFRVLCSPNNSIFHLIYDNEEDQWEIQPH
jgi:hypothetical protein